MLSSVHCQDVWATGLPSRVPHRSLAELLSSLYDPFHSREALQDANSRDFLSPIIIKGSEVKDRWHMKVVLDR